MFSVKNGLFVAQVTDGMIAQAQQIRRERDQLYGNRFPVQASDWRWVGDLGEIVFRLWLDSRGVTGYGWITEKPAGKADFVVNRHKIDVKTVKRQVRPQPHYTAQAAGEHLDHVDWVVFMTYHVARADMWLMGAISSGRMRREGEFYAAGDRVHAHFVARADIFNIRFSRLRLLAPWLRYMLGCETRVSHTLTKSY